MSGTSTNTLLRGVAATTALATSALSHMSWWLHWHTSSAGRGSRLSD